MARLEELTRGAAVRGILPDSIVTIIDVRWHGSAVAELTYRDAAGAARTAGSAPYLDYRPATGVERALVGPLLEADWLHADLESRVVSHAIIDLVPRHFDEVRRRKEELVDKTMAAVQDRLTKEITYWDHRAEALKLQEAAGKTNAHLNSTLARQRADDLAARLQKRMQELEQERRLSPQPPLAVGGALVVPAGLLARLRGDRPTEPAAFARATAEVERLAMEAVLARERTLGHTPATWAPASSAMTLSRAMAQRAGSSSSREMWRDAVASLDREKEPDN